MHDIAGLKKNIIRDDDFWWKKGTYKNFVVFVFGISLLYENVFDTWLLHQDIENYDSLIFCTKTLA